MMQHNNQNENIRFENSKPNIMIKGFLVFILTLIMLIPIPIILNIIEERQDQQQAVIKEIEKKWSAPQIIYGPFIQIEHYKYSKDDKGKPIREKVTTYASANENNIQTTVENRIKSRSIYDVVVYHSKNTIESKFPSYATILHHLEIDQENVETVKYVFAVKDAKGFDDRLVINSGNKNYTLTIDENYTLHSGTSGLNHETLPEPKANMNLDLFSRTIDPKSFDFNHVSLSFNLKGSSSFEYIPSALQTNVALTTNWKDLKFDGFALPNNEVIQNNHQKNVKWKIHQQKPINGQFWNGNLAFEDYKFGVEFLQMNDHYDKTYRSTKYAILFIGLTFVAFFFIENKNKFNIHFVQYALVGFAICINFVLLLSISEYLGFEYAYFISSCATLILITLFVKSFVGSWKLTFKISSMLIFIYAFIYSVLQLKEHALLVGSIGLFIILAIIMYYSKSIEWDSKKI